MFSLYQELQYVEEEQHRSKATLQSRIKDREDEIQKLRNQVGHITVIGPVQSFALFLLLCDKKKYLIS